MLRFALLCFAVLCCLWCCIVEAISNDYVYLGCVADQDDVVFNPKEGRLKPGTPGLPSLLLTMPGTYMAPITCASAAKRTGKRFFGLQEDTCRAGPSLINALRHSARRGVCTTWCAPDLICRGGGKTYQGVATSLHVFKNGKGELPVLTAMLPHLHPPGQAFLAPGMHMATYVPAGGCSNTRMPACHILCCSTQSALVGTYHLVLDSLLQSPVCCGCCRLHQPGLLRPAP
jgi:hypothetical protein